MRIEASLYCVYAIINTFLPQAVAAVVLYYGGTLVLAHRMSPGALVSFMLYQQSLAGAFQSVADVFGSLTAAVGAADKVRPKASSTYVCASAGSSSGRAGDITAVCVASVASSCMHA